MDPPSPPPGLPTRAGLGPSQVMETRDHRRGRILGTPAADVPPETMAGDPDWARAQSGDTSAFERLYHQHVARIHSLARRMAGTEAAEDLTQEVFIRAWEKLGSFRGDAAFGTWLHRLAVNWILSGRESLRKRQARHVAGENVFAGLRTRGDTPGLRIDFEGAMERLPDGAREVFVLYDVEGYPHKEIARMLDISVGTSKSQLHRARMLLREHLD